MSPSGSQDRQPVAQISRAYDSVGVSAPLPFISHPEFDESAVMVQVRQVRDYSLLGMQVPLV